MAVGSEDVASDITRLSIAELSSRIRERVLSAAEVLEAYVARIERWNGNIDAIVRLDVDRARARAASVDQALSSGRYLGPLHGVPFTLQDVLPVAGIGASAGGLATERTPAENGVLAERLTAAGGVFVGKTNISVDVRTRSEIGDLAKNPRNPARSAGGRSGGPAAAVAARFSAFDVALDVDGASRIAAAFCGVSALRPTMHRLPVADLVLTPPGWPRLDRLFNTVGPLARRPEDIALLLRVLAGPDPVDPEVPPVPVVHTPDVSLGGLRVARIPARAGVPVARAIQEVLDTTAHRLIEAGTLVQDAVPLPLAEVATALRRYAPVTLSLMTRAEVPPPTLLPAAVSPPTPFEIAELLSERDRLVGAFDAFMQRFDVILAPAVNVTAIPTDTPGQAIELEGKWIESSSISQWSLLALYVGAPSFVLPVGTDAGGMPVAVQLVGARFQDERLIATAAALERIVGPYPHGAPLAIRPDHGIAERSP